MDPNVNAAELDRRRLLAYLAGLGAVVAFGLGAAVEQVAGVAYPREMAVDSPEGPRLTVEWAVLYNGSQIDSGSRDEKGPLVTVGNLMPGDTGAFLFRIGVPETAEGACEVTLDLEVDDDAENGRNEPEREAGDADATGDLGETLETAAWYDTGVFDGERTPLDGRLLAEDPPSEGSFETVAEAVTDLGLVVDGESCLEPGTTVPVAVGWSLPSDVGNVAQGDSLAFSVSVSSNAGACGGS